MRRKTYNNIGKLEDYIYSDWLACDRCNGAFIFSGPITDPMPCPICGDVALVRMSLPPPTKIDDTTVEFPMKGETE